MIYAEVLIPLSLGLGEGPTAFHGETSEFLVVDIHEGNVHHCSLSGTSRISISRQTSIGAVALATDNSVLLAAGMGVETASGTYRIGIVGLPGDVRMNDGKADPVGRFVGGTMADPPRPGVGGLWSFSNGAPVKLLDDVTISNGLCWSSDGSTMFYIDTPTQRIDAFDYDLETGRISNRRTIVRIAEELGSPDGMTIDDDDGLWVAMWGGSAVHHYIDGHLESVISVPTPHVTSSAFVDGKLIITTAKEPCPNDPSAGHVYVADAGIGGPPPFLVDLRLVFASTPDAPV